MRWSSSMGETKYQIIIFLKWVGKYFQFFLFFFHFFFWIKFYKYISQLFKSISLKSGGFINMIWISGFGTGWYANRVSIRNAYKLDHLILMIFWNTYDFLFFRIWFGWLFKIVWIFIPCWILKLNGLRTSIDFKIPSNHLQLQSLISTSIILQKINFSFHFSLQNVYSYSIL